MDDQSRLADFLSRQTHMVVAVVCEDGTPWAVPVKIQHQQGNVFEWHSKTDSVHSLAIEAHPKIAITMFEKEHGREYGFYASATAEFIEELGKGYGHYRATVSRAWINDETFEKREVSLG